MIDSIIQGIPCQIKVESCLIVPSWRGSPHNCPSDLDFYGYHEIEFTVYDRKGYRAKWLEKKLTSEDTDRIEEQILEDHDEERR